MKSQDKKPRAYKLITPATVAQHRALTVLHGNGTAAVRENEPGRLGPKHRAFRIKTKSNQVAASEFIEDQLQQIGVDAVNRLGMLVNSSDERIAGVNTRYVLDQIRGKAVVRSVNLTGKINIQSVLD